MSLEEAIGLLNWLKFELKFIRGTDEIMNKNIKLSNEAIDIVLNELNKRIPIEKIEHDLESCKKVYEKEMQPYLVTIEDGVSFLNVTNLSRKEKEELVNKRNCLITQMETYKQLLNKE